ncbi:CNPV103 N1R/p28-like protein [Canarypox virus]|uniref:CNPV103 N1R/p28-like protein n=1 Tax=Canarypox virus TaxID=44088 RepID=Q6VZP4_CNPV|nr:CNPV103 N1R/p28-like protein [Canarypox virus]AAR83449.1 CNPV103 N1R/p28-like protein [Canarypox virus]AWD84579.1 N1R/p28-like protein [Canarypox virus]
MDFTRNITRHIDNNFCCIRYGNLELIMSKFNGYVNATKLCNLGNKRFRNWRRLQSSKELIKTLSNKNNDKVMIEVGLISNNVYKYELVGTYVHPDLVPYIVLWTFPNIAIIYSDIINRYLSNYFNYFNVRYNCVNPVYCFKYNYDRKFKKNTRMVGERYKTYTENLKDQNKILEYRIAKLEEKIKDLTTE